MATICFSILLLSLELVRAEVELGTVVRRRNWCGSLDVGEAYAREGRCFLQNTIRGELRSPTPDREHRYMSNGCHSSASL